jgi:hypothetical protein
LLNHPPEKRCEDAPMENIAPHKRTDRRLDCQMALSLVFGFVATTTAIVAFATVG